MLPFELAHEELDRRVRRTVRNELRNVLEPWLDANSSAKHLDMSVHHFWRLVREGKGPRGYGTRRLRRWRRLELDAWQMAQG